MDGSRDEKASAIITDPMLKRSLSQHYSMETVVTQLQNFPVNCIYFNISAVVGLVGSEPAVSSKNGWHELSCI